MAKTASAGVLSKLWRAQLYVLLFVMGAAAWASDLIPTLIDYWDEIHYLGAQHLMLVAISGALAIAVGVPLGVLLTRPRFKRAGSVVMQVLNIGATVPTLALLALAMSVLGIGNPTVIVGLFVATLLPIVANTAAGLRAVPPHLIEAAQGMGLSPGQTLRKVELPNALFMMYSGIRTGLAINVGTVPLAFLIGGGGLGELIFSGIALSDFSLMLAGAVPTALLAIAIDFLIAQIQYWSIPRGVNPLR